VIIIPGPYVSVPRRSAAHFKSLFLRSTLHSVGRAAILCTAFTVLIFFSAGPAVADVIDNGTDFQATDTTGDPTPGVGNPTSTVVADMVAPFSFGLETGNVESWVFQNSGNNPYSIFDGGSVAGALTFVYQINLTSATGDIASLGAADFGFYNTDVGYFDQTGSQVWPAYVSRDLSGPSDTTSTVTFSFFNNSDGTPENPGNYYTVNGGQSSALLVVNTDSTTWTNSYVTLQDDSNGTATSYAINSLSFMTPEPGSIVLMVLGMAGLLTVARARRSGRIAMRTGS